MKDPLLEAQISMALSHPLETVCFVIGGGLAFVGIIMLMMGASGRWGSHAMSMATMGSLIAFPAVLPMAMTLFGGIDYAVVSQTILDFLYVFVPILGLVVGISGFYGAEKNHNKTTN